MAEIYYIGGSPCSGKTTLTELLAKRHGLYHFKVDDYLEDYTTRGRSKGKPVCTRITKMSANETWMRSPELQNQEELEFYREIFEYVLFDLNRKNDKRAIITEGAAYLPELMKKNALYSNNTDKILSGYALPDALVGTLSSQGLRGQRKGVPKLDGARRAFRKDH